jgi:DNA (cytosine-5)-methyltransferase 1
MEDPRNHLAWDYVKFLESVRPDGFVFENVTGLLNMHNGKVFSTMRDAFSDAMPSLSGKILSTENFGIPQRRKRVIIVGFSKPGFPMWDPPIAVTRHEKIKPLIDTGIDAPSVEEAISDLPEIGPGEDGSELCYRCEPKNIYQALMRGYITPDNYLSLLSSGNPGLATL